jgi:ribonuclease G
MDKRVLVNCEEKELRVAFLENGELVELFIEKSDDKTIVGNMYRGTVEDVVPGLHAAFVDVGLERRTFLHFHDIRSEALDLYQKDSKPRGGSARRTGGYRGRIGGEEPPVKRGDVLLVQVVKDEIGDKAPRVTTNLSLPGRYLVLLPFPSQEGGVSRKIDPGQDRYRLKRLLNSIRTDGLNYIVRTAGVEAPDEAVRKDVAHLSGQWTDIVERFRSMERPGIAYDDQEILYRLVRDIVTPDVNEILIDSPAEHRKLLAALDHFLPELVDKVKLVDPTSNVLRAYQVDKQVQKALKRRVWLKSGGYVVFDEMEALTAIDVNTGRYIGKKDQEKTILQTNLEAAEVMAQQLRLRDIGGIVVCDFIDMASRENQNLVIEELRKHLKRDRAKIAMTRIGEFGLMQLTRKRVRQSLRHQVFVECPYCGGTGRILSEDEVWRNLKYEMLDLLHAPNRPGAVCITAHPQFLDYLQREYADALHRVSLAFDVVLTFSPCDSFHLEEYQLSGVDPAEARPPLKLARPNFVRQ